MIALTGRGVPIVAIGMVAMMLLAGITVGANEAAAGGEQIDLSDRLHDELFTDSGELDVDEREAAGPEFEIGPKSPRLNDVLRETVARPLIKGSIWAADVGFQIGYGMVLTFGADVTRLILNGSVVLTLTAVGWRVLNRTRDVAREVNV